jgi:trimethylamine-N-oxide reductase (cytochrome c) cytochrome c-type subunit TorY
MKEPIRRWKESGAAANHLNCAGCHYDSSLAGWWEMNWSAVKFLVVHFTRNADEPIQPRHEPLFLEQGREPGYWTRVPNHRCFQCHNAKNHAREDQERIHEKAVKDISSKPCLDCHSHEMRNGQKFYERVLPKQEQTARNGDST